MASKKNTSCKLLLLFMSWVLLMPVHADISVTDDAGQPVVLDRPARRIISLAPHITELLFSAGAGDAVVGVTEYSDYPAAAKSITRVGGGGSLDLERIIALQPDLVVAWQSGNPNGQVKRLQSLGLTVFMSEPRRLEDVPDTLLRLGRLSGTDAVAAAGANDFNRHYGQLKKRYAQRRAVTVFYQVWEQPLMTVNGEHLISDVIRLCGGRNIFDTLPSLAPQIDVESVLAGDPEVIIIGADEKNSSLLAAWQRWPKLSAVSHGHVYAIQRELLVRHSMRILEGAEELCVMLENARM
jgi:iron complex transport system substrate-binding protein